MVKVFIGDIFESRAQTLVNTVNTVGVMGKGIALGFKQRFPDMYEDYLSRCRANEVRLGRPYLFRRLIPPWILNFPTKEHWRSVARLSDIINGLVYLGKHYKEWEIVSLAVPPLGCGEGQLEWRVVGPTLYRHLARLDIQIELYAPYGTPHEELQPVFLEKVPAELTASPSSERLRIEPGWVALVEVLAQIEKERFHWPVGRIAFQKIAYFATLAGIPTGLKYSKGSFGPHAPNLKAIVGRLVNNGLINEDRLGRMFMIRLGSTFADARQAYKEDLERWRLAIDRVVDLFVRMSTREAELAATVQFAAASLRERLQEEPTEANVLNEVMTWKQKRRPPFKEDEVALAIRSLSALRWLDVIASDLSIDKEELLEV